MLACQNNVKTFTQIINSIDLVQNQYSELKPFLRGFFLYILWSKLASHVFEFYTQGYICTSWYKSQARSECYSEFINPSAKEFKYVTFYDPELNSLANSCLSPNYCKIYRKRNHEAIIKWSFHIIFWVESPHTKRA